MDDFKNPDGLPKLFGGRDAFSMAVYRDEDRQLNYNKLVQIFYTAATTADPQGMHLLFNDIAREGRLLRLFTQNVDGLELRCTHLYTQTPLRASKPWPNVVQLHGSLHWMECISCHYLCQIDISLFSGTHPPACPLCQVRITEAVERGSRSTTPGILRPRILLYDDTQEWDTESIAAVVKHDLKSKPDVLLVAGTALKVPGAVEIVRKCMEAVRKSGGRTIWISKERPNAKVKDGWDHEIRGSCEKFALAMAG